jgi:hypothetical protein
VDKELAVDIMDEYVAKDKTGCVIEAWRPLKAAVLAQQTNNKQSTPLSSTCIGCGAIINNVYCDDCRRRLSS